MESDAEGCPLRFFWQGRRHQVQQVVQRWQVDSDWWSPEGRIWRDYSAVVTGDGLLCVIFYDHLLHEWRLTRVYD
jgi:hypothetical protein